MVFKIRTAKKTMEYFEEITSSTNYAPFTLARMSISMSLMSQNKLKEPDFHTDTMGLELNRQTITGEWDDLYKALIEILEQRHINDDDYFPKYIKAHLDRGAKMLYAEYKYNGDLLTALLNDEKTI